MEIHYLADNIAFAPTLAQWHYDEWNALEQGDSEERRLGLLTERANRSEVPTIFVAVEAGRLLGSASLVEHDMETRRDLTPWLADVFVAPQFRRRGIASALVSRVVREAAALGTPELWLWTTGAELEKLYAGLGWSVRDRPFYLDKRRVLMSIAPSRVR